MFGLEKNVYSVNIFSMKIESHIFEEIIDNNEIDRNVLFEKENEANLNLLIYLQKTIQNNNDFSGNQIKCKFVEKKENQENSYYFEARIIKMKLEG